MKRAQWLVVLLCVLPGLDGCLWHTRRVQQAVLPRVLKEATADELVQQMDAMHAELSSLSATVDFQASVGGSLKGKVTDYTALSGYILLKQPGMVHVVGLVPVIRSRAFELVSDGGGFELYIPSQNRVIEGSNTVGTPSAKPLENLRPGLFFQAMIPQAVGPGELVTLTNANVEEEDPQTHVKATLPEYALEVMRQREGSQVLVQQRVVHFSRVNLRPVRVESYGANGALETVVTYGPFMDFGGGWEYPKTITIRRPLEEYQIVVTVEKVEKNPALTAEQFELKMPEGVTVQKLP
jgi:outer membrane lipoprotein-sorting protein